MARVLMPATGTTKWLYRSYLLAYSYRHGPIEGSKSPYSAVSFHNLYNLNTANAFFRPSQEEVPEHRFDQVLDEQISLC
ncbi:hypothetical protein HZS_2876 [Henneguya salminicola]|nr:hypothetical protein HZS_2876 [Henneguya salminicola]